MVFMRENRKAVLVGGKQVLKCGQPVSFNNCMVDGPELVGIEAIAKSIKCDRMSHSYRTIIYRDNI